MVSKFLQFTNYHDQIEATGKRVNRGVGIETRKTYELFFYGDAIVITWTKISSEKLDNELHVKVKTCVKQKHACVFDFPNQS